MKAVHIVSTSVHEAPYATVFQMRYGMFHTSRHGYESDAYSSIFCRTIHKISIILSNFMQSILSETFEEC